MCLVLTHLSIRAYGRPLGALVSALEGFLTVASWVTRKLRRGAGGETDRAKAVRVEAPPAGLLPPPTDCDLVMKGGITSGVVYPAALWVLSGQYRFRNIGGASAGAIAAVIAAAAQLGDKRDAERRLLRLDKLANTIAAPGFLPGLFQPYKAAKGPYQLLLSFVTDSKPLVLRLVRLLIQMVGRVWPVLLLAAGGSWAVWYGYGGWSSVPALVLIAAGLVVVAVAWPVLTLWRVLDEKHGFGLCSGNTMPGHGEKGLLDWIYEEVQTCA